MELEIIKSRIYQVKGFRVMLDFDLAELYEVPTKALKQAVKRNLDRFPEDFMFELSQQEYSVLRSQNVTLKNPVDSRGKHSKYAAYAFTEQGVAMLSSILRSKKAIQVHISIMRAFVFMRQNLVDIEDIKARVENIEQEMTIRIDDIYQVLNYLVSPSGQRPVVKGYRK